MIHKYCEGNVIPYLWPNGDPRMFDGKPVLLCLKCRSLIQSENDPAGPQPQSDAVLSIKKSVEEYEKIHNPPLTEFNSWCRVCNQKIPGVFQPANTGGVFRDRFATCKRCTDLCRRGEFLLHGVIQSFVLKESGDRICRFVSLINFLGELEKEVPIDN